MASRARIAKSEAMSIDRIIAVYRGRAERRYGLSQVSQLEHALQAAALAERAGAPDEQIVAALLHDIGHMVHDLGESPAERGVDDRHECLGSAYLSQWFPREISEPVRLHVPAKRFLVATEPAYRNRLSPDSIRSLQLQGGPMTPAEQAAFKQQAFWREAVMLRRFDEDAKLPGAITPALRDFMPVIEACLSANRCQAAAG